MLTTQLRFIFITSVIVISLGVTYSFELPFLQTCTIEDEKCHMEQVNKFFELYANGIPELNISTFDPLYLGDVHIKGNSNENFNLQLFMDDMVLYKFPILKCLSIKGFSTDFSKPLQMVLKMFMPELINKSHCRVKGKLLIFNVEGETDLTVNIRNLTTIIKSSVKPYTKDGYTYYKVDRLKPRLDIGSLSVSFANSTLFNGEQVFIDTFADTINSNWIVFRDEIEPHLSQAFERVALDALNKILATMPAEKFFKESE